MHTYMLEEMADALSTELHIQSSDALAVLSRYWEDKIAPVWSVEDVYECAYRSEKPITRELAIEVLERAFDKHDAEYGISWITLDVTLEDFLSRVDPRSQEAEYLAKVGALDGLGTIPAILKRLGSGWMAGQMSLFSLNEMVGEDWSLEEKMAAQQELLGASLEAHPLELLSEQIARSGAITTAEAAERIGQRVTVAGIRQTSRRSRTARGEMMMFLSVEDLSGMLDVIIFPDVFQRAKSIASSNSPMLITGTVETDGERDEPFLKAEKIERLA